jgi:hypothetical protein
MERYPSILDEMGFSSLVTLVCCFHSGLFVPGHAGVRNAQTSPRITVKFKGGEAAANPPELWSLRTIQLENSEPHYFGYEHQLPPKNSAIGKEERR